MCVISLVLLLYAVWCISIRSDLEWDFKVLLTSVTRGRFLQNFECGLIFPMSVNTRISLKTFLRNDYQDLIRYILKENTWGVMDASDNPGKNQIKLPHFLLATARWATGVPLPLLTVACVIQTVGAEDKSEKFFWAKMQTRIRQHLLSCWFAGKIFLAGPLNYFCFDWIFWIPPCTLGGDKIRFLHYFFKVLKLKKTFFHSYLPVRRRNLQAFPLLLYF